MRLREALLIDLLPRLHTQYHNASWITIDAYGHQPGVPHRLNGLPDPPLLQVAGETVKPVVHSGLERLHCCCDVVLCCLLFKPACCKKPDNLATEHVADLVSCRERSLSQALPPHHGEQSCAWGELYPFAGQNMPTPSISVPGLALAPLNALQRGTRWCHQADRKYRNGKAMAYFRLVP